MQGGVFASAANAADPTDETPTYEPADGWQETLDKGANAKHPTLTVKKYVTNNEGKPATGSIDDDNHIDKAANKPAPNVVFELVKISPISPHTESDFNQADITSQKGRIWREDSTVFDGYGETDENGVIDKWYPAVDYSAASGNTPASVNKNDAQHPAIDIPVEHQYYLLREIAAPAGYQKAEESIFDLPYGAFNMVNGKSTWGYVYNLHVYPKNINNQPVSKTLTSVEHNGVTVNNPPVVVAGDVAHFTISQKIDGVTFTPSTAQPNQPADTFYLSNVEGKDADIRIVDRLSSIFETPTTYESNVKLRWDGDNGGYSLSQVSDNNPNGLYQESGVLTGQAWNSTSGWNNRMTRIFGDTTDSIFPDEQNGTISHDVANSAHYLVWNFFHGVTGTQLIANSGIPANAQNIHLEIAFSVPVTGKGDSLGHNANDLVNDVASDTNHGKNNENHSHTATAGFQFGKTNKPDKDTDPVVRVNGAVFRLQNPDNENEWLGTDGQFHTNAWYTDSTKNTKGASAIEATSVNGIVTFKALPLFQITTNADHTETAKFNDGSTTQPVAFKVFEYQVPAGYVKPNVNGWLVTFFHNPNVTNDPNDQRGKDVTAATDHKNFLPVSGPSFGEYQLKREGYTITNIDGTSISNILMNYTKPQPQPIHLPLTGGMGIVLLLVIGAVIMAIVIIERKRREANARR